jgi:hypothetical protein
MARPTTKQELIIAGNEQFKKLRELINSMSDEEQNAVFLFEDRDKNIRDVLIHLYEWHRLLLNWTTANCKGETMPFLPAPYNWRTYPEMNVEFWKKHQNTSYDVSMSMLVESHAKVIAMIESFSDEELFVKKHFAWTGTPTLGSYCVSATSSHYNWAMKKIKKHVKTYKKIQNKMKLTQTDLISNMNRIHTTEMGKKRIRKNLCMDIDDVVSWCKQKIMNPDSRIIRNGKNWYVYIDGCKISVNARNYTIITAHKDENNEIQTG